MFVVQPKAAYLRIRAERDRLTQAVLEIESEIVDGRACELDRILDDETFKSLIASIGVGIDISESWLGGASLLQLDDLRYGKIILVFDETPQGRQTKDRLLLLLRRFLAPLIATGRVYLSSAAPSSIYDDDRRVPIAVT